MAQSVCPWWLGYVLASPVRKWIQDPEKVLNPFVKEGMTALDIGPGMGFFTLPMARLVGSRGKVIAVDLQEKMIASLRRRARRQGSADRVECRVCRPDSLGIDDLAGRIDFALTFAVLHEMPSIQSALASVSRTLKPGGRLLIAEPSGHVDEAEFKETISIAGHCGLTVIETPMIKRSLTALMQKEA